MIQKKLLDTVIVQCPGQNSFPANWWGGGEMEKTQENPCPLCGGYGFWHGWDGLGYAAPCPCEKTSLPYTERGYEIVLESPWLQSDWDTRPFT